MRHVIYANDMEPLTVIELSDLAESYLWRWGYVVLHLPVLNVTTLSQTHPVQLDQGLKSVRLRAEVFHRHSSRHLIICTEDEESALLLKCVFLPGQYGGLHELERKAFAKGFINAWQRLGQSF